MSRGGKSRADRAAFSCLPEGEDLLNPPRPFEGQGGEAPFLSPEGAGAIGGGASYTAPFPPEGAGVIGGGAPYTKKGWRVGIEKFRLRASFFLRAQKETKDALRGARARWVSRLRFAAAVTHTPRPLRDLPHLRGLAHGRWRLRPARKAWRPFSFCAGRYGLSWRTKPRLRWSHGAWVPELTAPSKKIRLSARPAAAGPPVPGPPGRASFSFS